MNTSSECTADVARMLWWLHLLTVFRPLSSLTLFSGGCRFGQLQREQKYMWDLSASQAVEDVWCCHIICTRKLTICCDGRSQVSVLHDPTITSHERYETCLQAYKQKYGADPPVDIWPVMSATSDIKDHSDPIEISD